MQAPIGNARRPLRKALMSRAFRCAFLYGPSSVLPWLGHLRFCGADFRLGPGRCTPSTARLSALWTEYAARPNFPTPNRVRHGRLSVRRLAPASADFHGPLPGPVCNPCSAVAAFVFPGAWLGDLGRRVPALRQRNELPATDLYRATPPPPPATASNPLLQRLPVRGETMRIDV